MGLRIPDVLLLLVVASVSNACSVEGAGPGDEDAGPSDAASDGPGADTGSDVDADVDAGVLDGPASDGDGSAEDAPETVWPLPNAPASITFRDSDPRRGWVDGTISVARAADESGVSSYRVYWTDGAGARVAVVGELPRSSAKIEFVLAPGTSIPAAALHLAAVAVGATSIGTSGESSPVATKGDNFPVHLDPSDGIIGADTLVHPSVFVDAAAGKILVVSLSRTLAEARRCNLDGTACTAISLDPDEVYHASDQFLATTVDPVFGKVLAILHDARDGSAILLRCNLDGSGCTHANLSATLAASYAWGEAMAVDVAGKKFLDVSGGTLLRCELDGSACSATTLPRALMINGRLLVDDVASKVLVVGHDGSSPYHPFLLRCDLDGTSCTELDLSNQGLTPLSYPSAAIDRANAKLVIVRSWSGDIWLSGCELDGTACSTTDLSLSLGLPAMSGVPLPLIDAANGKLVVAARPLVKGSGPVLRCDLDGTNCTSTAVTPWPWSSRVDVALDVASAKLLFVGPSDVPMFGPAPPPTLVRSNLDGSGATTQDISAGIGGDLAWSVTGAIDAANKKLVVVTDDEAHGDRAWLHRCDLDGTGCTHADLSAGLGDSTGKLPAVAIDAANGKLLVATMLGGTGAPLLVRCNVDGTQCAFANLPSQGVNSGQNPAIAIDATSSKILVVTQNGANDNKPSLFRCELDGTGCTHTDLAPNGPGQSGVLPSLIVLPSALLVVTSPIAGVTPDASLFRCALDGTGCVHTWLPPGTMPRAIVAANKLIVVGGGNPGAVAFIRCELDGSACTSQDLTAGPGVQIAFKEPRAVVDTAVNKLFVLVATQVGAVTNYGAGLFRCELDGTACSYADAADGIWGVVRPVPIFDATNARLVDVFQDAGNRQRPGVLLLDDW